MLAVRKENTTGLEYTRSLTDEQQKQRAAASINRIYSVATYVFVIGILSVGALFVISIFNKSPTGALVCEATVLICLIALLVLVSRTRRRMNEQRVHSERYPYTGVDKKEIDKIFDLIEEEEKKRERLNLFAAGGNSSASAVKETPARSRREKVSGISDEPEIPVIVADKQEVSERQPEEEENVSVLEDELNDVEIRMRAMADEDEVSGAAESGNKSVDDEESYDEDRPRREKRPGDPSRQRSPQGKRPPQGKGKKRPPEGVPRDPRDPRAPQGGKRRRPPVPYDPYYGGVYYDEYGRPIRRPPPYDPYYGGEYYYDEYGNPIRRREAPYGKERVVYDEYGRPIKRRPPAGQDPRKDDAARRKRPAAPGADSARRRPDGAPLPPGAARPGSKQRPAAPADSSKRTAAPVAMPSLKRDFDEDYVPVSVAYDDEVDNNVMDAEKGVVLRANQGKRGASAPAAPPKPVFDDESDYSPSDMEAVPIIVDDDYNPDYGEEEFGVPASAAKPAAHQRRPGTPANVPDYYYQGDDDPSPTELDAGVVVVHDFDDIDQDEYDARYSREYGTPVGGTPARKNTPAYAVEEESYSYEDEESVVVLPRDENYEDYLRKVKAEEEKKRIEEEKRRIEERKQARRKSGKVALSIRKVRRKKIHRMSRKYKRFRASVVPLVRYLNK